MNTAKTAQTTKATEFNDDILVCQECADFGIESGSFKRIKKFKLTDSTFCDCCGETICGPAFKAVEG